MDVNVRDARKLFLHQQGMLRNDTFGRGINGLEKTLQRLTYLQIDTISVVDRAHHHVAGSRVSNFTPAHLDKLVSDRRAFEYWSHAAAFLPMENFRFALPVMRGFGETRNHDKKLAKQVLNRIRHEGPLQSKDFENTSDKKGNGWWDWKPAKKALEHLFLSGELMVKERAGFQKVFDLPENVLPGHIDTSHPTEDEWADAIIQNQVEALGIATTFDLSYARPTIWRLARINLKDALQASITRQLQDGRLLETRVAADTYYTTPSLLAQLPLRISRGPVRILSPFDNLIINRRRTQALFDFDYQLECYVPAPKRRYGYFVLPLLWGDEFVGRLDAKADRKNHRFEIRNLVLEDHIKITDSLLGSLARGLQIFIERHQCDQFEIHKTTPASLKTALRKRLQEAMQVSS